MMKHFKKSFFLQLLCFLALVDLPVYGLDNDKSFIARNRGDLRVGFSVLTDTFDTVAVWHMLHFTALEPTVQTLVRINNDRRIQGDLATKWEISELGDEYVFHIDRKAKFHDGTNITSDDVAYSLARHLWPSSKSVIKRYLVNVLFGADHLPENKIPSGIIMVDPYKIKLKLKGPYPPLIELLAIPGFGIVKRGTSGSKFNPPITSGPMEPKYLPSENVWRLIPSRFFSGDKSRQQTMVFMEVLETDRAADLIKRNEVDIVFGFSDPDLDQVILMAKYKKIRLDSMGTMHIYFNNGRGIFSNDEMRKDLGRLLQNKIKTIGSPGYYLEFEPYFIPLGVMPRDYYVRDENDMTKDVFKKKWVEYIKGKRLQVFMRKEFLSDDVHKIIKATLAEVGFDVVYEKKMFVDLLPYLKSENYDMVMMGYFGIMPDPDVFLDLLNPNAEVLRYGVIPSKPLYKQLEKIRFIKSPAERMSYYSAVVKLFESEYYFVPLYRFYYSVILHDRVKLPESKYRIDLRLSDIELIR